MAFQNITNADTTGKGVVGLPDVPGLSTGAMQQKFDELAMDVIIPKYNDTVNQLNGTGVATNSQMTDPVDGTTKTVQQTANSLKSYVDTQDATKADKATTLAGYNITDAYTKTEADTLLAGKADNATTLAGYGITDAYTKTETDNALATKADKATTLAGYGITDAYTKTETDNALATKADKATTLAGYGITDAYTKTQADNLLAGKVDKVAGKGLSTNDYDGTEKANVAANTAARHTHANKTVLDAITSLVKSGYDAVVTLLAGITGVETSITNDNTKVPTSGAVVNYVSALGGGDMLKSVYDTNDDGTVNAADYATSAGDSSKLGGSLPSYYAASGDLQTLFGDVATYQSTATALRNYAVGDFMVYQNNFYEVTQAIASGGTIVPNTNVTKTTVGAVLTVLGASSGQHVIEDPSGTSMTPRTNLAFADAHITDNALDNKTEVEIAKEVTEAAFDSLNPVGTEHDGAYLMEVADAVPLTADMVGYDGGTVKGALDALAAPNAGAHNAIYRGKYLGTSVTADQYSAISAGTFDDLFIGDYWTIGGVNYRIAAFDYWLRTGDTECTTHHVVIVPDSNLTTAKMNDTSITTGGYVGSDIYTGNNSNTGLSTAKTTINSAFGSAHILTHRGLLTNAVSGNAASGWVWYDSTVELMNETMVYGHEANSEKVAGGLNYNVGIDKTQLPLFAHDPSKITNRAAWWLRSVVSSANFARVYTYGIAYDASASNNSYGVRPAFAIKA